MYTTHMQLHIFFRGLGLMHSNGVLVVGKSLRAHSAHFAPTVLSFGRQSDRFYRKPKLDLQDQPVVPRRISLSGFYHDNMESIKRDSLFLCMHHLWTRIEPEDAVCRLVILRLVIWEP